jgi:hypothetical protein
MALAGFVRLGVVVQFQFGGSGLLCTRTYSEVGSVLEVTFSAFTTERV